MYAGAVIYQQMQLMQKKTNKQNRQTPPPPPPPKKYKNKNELMIMVVNATSSNISVISWRSVSLVEETGISGENHRPAASH